MVLGSPDDKSLALPLATDDVTLRRKELYEEAQKAAAQEVFKKPLLASQALELAQAQEKKEKSKDKGQAKQEESKETKEVKENKNSKEPREAEDKSKTKASEVLQGNESVRQEAKQELGKIWNHMASAKENMVTINKIVDQGGGPYSGDKAGYDAYHKNFESATKSYETARKAADAFLFKCDENGNPRLDSTGKPIPSEKNIALQKELVLIDKEIEKLKADNSAEGKQKLAQAISDGQAISDMIRSAGYVRANQALSLLNNRDNLKPEDQKNFTVAAHQLLEAAAKCDPAMMGPPADPNFLNEMRKTEKVQKIQNVQNIQNIQEIQKASKAAKDEKKPHYVKGSFAFTESEQSQVVQATRPRKFQEIPSGSEASATNTKQEVVQNRAIDSKQVPLADQKTVEVQANTKDKVPLPSISTVEQIAKSPSADLPNRGPDRQGSIEIIDKKAYLSFEGDKLPTWVSRLPGGLKDEPFKDVSGYVRENGRMSFQSTMVSGKEVPLAVDGKPLFESNGLRRIDTSGQIMMVLFDPTEPKQMLVKVVSEIKGQLTAKDRDNFRQIIASADKLDRVSLARDIDGARTFIKQSESAWNFDLSYRQAKDKSNFEKALSQDPKLLEQVRSVRNAAARLQENIELMGSSLNVRAEYLTLLAKEPSFKHYMNILKKPDAEKTEADFQALSALHNDENLVEMERIVNEILAMSPKASQALSPVANALAPLKQLRLAKARAGASNNSSQTSLNSGASIPGTQVSK